MLEEHRSSNSAAVRGMPCRCHCHCYRPEASTKYLRLPDLNSFYELKTRSGLAGHKTGADFVAEKHIHSLDALGQIR